MQFWGILYLRICFSGALNSNLIYNFKFTRFLETKKSTKRTKFKLCNFVRIRSSQKYNLNSKCELQQIIKQAPFWLQLLFFSAAKAWRRIIYFFQSTRAFACWKIVGGVLQLRSSSKQLGQVSQWVILKMFSICRRN